MKTKAKTRLTIYCFLLMLSQMLLSIGLQAQTTQTIKGVVTDTESAYPLIGVSVQWVQEEKTLGTITDIDGNFQLENIPIGRQSFVCSYVGYKTIVVDNILIGAGKEIFLDLQMEEKITELASVTVTDKASNNPVNEMVLLGASSVKVEEVVRYAGSNGDVSRMVQNYAGISGASDDRNDIIVRGNSPSSVLWRIDGIDIPSPNHWATLGTSGGPISMLNTNNLRTSDFLSGAFPAEYGNVTGAVFDLKLRNGNANKFEFLGQIGFNGFEGGIEGPLRGVGQNASFIANYRYSTLGVVSALGVDFGTGFAVPEYQDLNFKINIPTKKSGRFSLWGLGGISNINFLAEEGENNLYSNGQENLRSGTTTGMMGLNHLYFFNDKSSSSFSLLASHSNNETFIEEIRDPNSQRFEKFFVSNNIQNKYAINWTYNQKINAKNRVKFGVNYDLYNFNVVDSVLLSDQIWFRELDFEDQTSLVRAFGQWKHKLNDKLTMNAGLNVLWFTLNNSSALEPRLSFAYQVNEKAKLALGYGRHSQLLPIPIYFSKDDRATAAENKSNEELDFMKSDHFILSFTQAINNKLSIKAEAYYQNLFSIGTDPNDLDFSLINFGASFGFPNRVGLTNDGKGRNYGLEITINQSLNKGFYYLITGSLFNSTYEGEGGVDRNTYYNSNYVFNTLMGKEFVLNSKWTLTLDGRFTYSGGRRYTPIDLASSIAEGREVLFEDRAFEARLAPYIRPDIKMGFRLNGKKATQTFSVDFQNFINRENEFIKSYSRSRESIRTERQRGFFPDVRYQIVF